MNLSEEKPADDVILDGSTPPAQTIIFENTNFRGADLPKGRGTPPSQAKQAPAPAQKQTNEKVASAKADAAQTAAVAAAMSKEDLQ